MAFKKVEHYGKSTSLETLTVHIRMGGQIFLGGLVLNDFPVTNEHRTVDLYIDTEKNLLALLPLRGPFGVFNISRTGTGKQICCSRFLDRYRIVRNQKCVCKIEDINGSKMIVFQVEREKEKE